MIPLCQFASAETLEQVREFDASNAGNPYVGSGSAPLVESGFFRANFMPFDSALGTLESFELYCSVDGVLRGTAGSLADIGGTDTVFGGTFKLNNSAFDGAGTPEKITATAPAGDPLEMAFSMPVYSKTFLVANAGFNYDPAILVPIQGNSEFEMLFDAGVVINYENVEAVEASLASTMILTYTYKVANGEVETIQITSIRRNVDEESVTVTWTAANGRSYTVDASENLSDWTSVANAVQGSGASATFVEENIPATIPRRFYRIRENN